jgi:hypothetical protein
VTLQDVVADQEFQVYVTLYSNSQITDAQFTLDEPSGVKIDPTDVNVDGARGIEFLNNAPRMNDTREVWFIHDRFLYEVTTYKELNAWPADPALVAVHLMQWPRPLGQGGGGRDRGLLFAGKERRNLPRPAITKNEP